MLKTSMQSALLTWTGMVLFLGGCSPDGALITAAENGNVGAIERSLQDGANVNARSGYNRTNPTWAARNDDVGAVVLWVKGADVGNSMTGLMLAAARGHVNAVKVLLDSGADINARDVFGNTALMFAAEEGNPEVVKVLLDRNADINAKDRLGGTALMAASGDAGIGKMLLEKLPSGKVSLSLSMNARPDNTEVVEVLLKKGADVRCRDKYGGTALARAAHAGHLGAVRLLLNANADVNANGIDGSTVLMLASEEGNAEVVKLLLGKNVAVNAKDKSGKTAVDLAKSSEIRRLLRAAGAD